MFDIIGNYGNINGNNYMKTWSSYFNVGCGGWGAMALETMRVSYHIIVNIIDTFLKIDLKLSKANDGHTSL